MPSGMQNTTLRPAQEKGRWGFDSLGAFAKSVRSAVTGGGVDPRLVQNATLSTYGAEETGADGGFAVPPDFRTEIQSLVMGEASMLAQCDSMPTSSNRVTFPTDESTAWQTSGGVLTYWGSEAGAMTQSKPALREAGVTLHKLYAFVPVTDEMLEDVPMMGRYLTGKAGEKLDFQITDAIINGTGAGKPLGLMNAACKVAVAKEGSQAADTIVAGAGFVDHQGQDPNIPQPAAPIAPPMPDVGIPASPMDPAMAPQAPPDSATGLAGSQQGIETPTGADNGPLM